MHNNRPLPELIDINATIAAIGQKGVHVKFPTSDEISLANFNHFAIPRNTGPHGMQEIAGERVEYQVHAFTFCFTHNTLYKRTVPGIKDPVPWNVESLHQELHFLVIADGHVNLCPQNP
jgi:hypothetical protein